jgi:hypothetical protein
MPRILLVAQETGGVGKSTLSRGIAEAVPDAPIVELESTQRILEYDHGRTKGPKRVSHFPVRADRASIDRTGGQAARAEFDGPIVVVSAPPKNGVHRSQHVLTDGGNEDRYRSGTRGSHPTLPAHAACCRGMPDRGCRRRAAGRRKWHSAVLGVR